MTTTARLKLPIFNHAEQTSKIRYLRDAAERLIDNPLSDIISAIMNKNSTIRQRCVDDYNLIRSEARMMGEDSTVYMGSSDNEFPCLLLLMIAEGIEQGMLP